MNRRASTTALGAAALLALGGCTTDRSDTSAETAAHETLREALSATAAQDWEHVYELTSAASRPANRTRWIEQRSDRDGGFIDRCVGDADGSPDIDLTTLEPGENSMIVEAVVWTRDDQGTVCHWRVVEEPTGWRVDGHVDRVRTEEPS